MISELMLLFLRPNVIWRRVEIRILSIAVLRAREKALTVSNIRALVFLSKQLFKLRRRRCVGVRIL